MSNYIDANGTKVFMDNEMSDKELTETINNSKTVEELKRQNDLYAKELKNNHAFNIWTIILSAVSAMAAIASVVMDIYK